MKKITLLCMFAVFVSGIASVHAQCYKYPLFEHFTQASCGPCAQQNPGFQSSILDPNPNSVRHIAYHTSWPGYDPMYNVNPTQSDDRVNYYNVTGVPDLFLQGNYKEAQPGGMTMGDVNTIVSQTSPVKIVVADVDNGTSHDVTVTVKSIGIVPTGSWNLMNVVIERNVTYINPPGNNGETYFPNVMKLMIPNSSGDAVTLPAQGTESTFTYTYDEDASWNMSEIGVVSFLQNTSTKEVLNAGSSFDIVQNAVLYPPVTTAADGVAGANSSFPFTAGTAGGSDEDFTFSLTSDAPSDWTGTFTINGVTASSATIGLTAGAGQLAGTIDVTPGATPAFATYTLSIIPANNPDAPAMLTQVFVISGVTDLVVNNAAGNGVTPGDAAEWQEGFINGMNFSGCTTYDSVYHTAVQTALSQGALTGVSNLYLNIGWSFPGLTDEFVDQLKPFMDNGGNVFISGQDVAWETFDEAASPYWSQNKQDFFLDYLNVNWISDGSSANKPLTANMDDIYTSIPSATINAYYGATYFYPDQLDVVNNSIPIFYYNNNVGKIAGIRSNDGHKVVFLGVGLEMIGTDDDKEAIIKTTYDWFHGNITSAQFDQQMASVMGQNFPNPSGDLTFIPVSGLTSDMTFMLTDQLGRILVSQPVQKTSSKVVVNTNGLNNGVYFYRLVNGSQESVTKTMEVIH
jgi:hypothetical protein